MGGLVNHWLTTVLASIVAGLIITLNIFLLYQTFFEVDVIALSLLERQTATTLNLDRLPTTLARLASAQAICKECARLASLSSLKGI